VSSTVVPRRPVVAILHARSVEPSLPLLVAAEEAKGFALPVAIDAGRQAGSALVPETFAGSILVAVRTLGCLIRLNVVPWVKKEGSCSSLLDVK